MRTTMLGVAGGVCAFLLAASSTQAQEFQPSCDRCPATYVSAEEIAGYMETESTDQRIRTVDIGKANLNVALVQRGRLEEPAGAAEHSSWYRKDLQLPQAFSRLRSGHSARLLHDPKDSE